MGSYEVILRVNRRQFKCEYYEKPFSETLNFVGNRKKLHIDMHKFILSTPIKKAGRLAKYQLPPLVNKILLS